MPEIALSFCKFNRDLPSAPLFRIDINYAAFALFFCETIHDQNLLAELYRRLHVEQPAVQANSHRGSYIAERVIPGSSSVNFDGNRKREALATAALNHGNLLRSARIREFARLKGRLGDRSNAMVLR